MAAITPEELNLLIEQTYKVEKEFNELKAPNAIWILNSDDGTVFLQNSHARELWQLLKLLEYQEEDYEIKFQGHSYHLSR